MTDALEAPLEDRVGVAQRRVLGKALAQQLDGVAHPLQAVLREVLRDAAGTDVRVVHAQAADRLEAVEDQLTVAEAARHDRQRADLHAPGGDADQVRADAVELEHQDPDVLRPLGHLVLDLQESLDGGDVGGLVRERGHVVHAGAERDALRPRAVLHVLLDARVQVADAGPGVGDGLSVDLQHEAEHAVRRRVLRAHVDDDVVAVGQRRVDRVPVLAGDGEDRAVGRLRRARVRVVRRRHEYLRRSSGAGIVAPLYSTGMPPRG